MAREAMPKRTERATMTGDKPRQSKTVSVTIPKGSGDEAEYANLMMYRNLGYTIKDEGYVYIGEADREHVKAQQLEYQRKGLAQAGQTKHAQDFIPDTADEFTISTIKLGRTQALMGTDVPNRDILDDDVEFGSVTP